jgi:hypothetical protein
MTIKFNAAPVAVLQPQSHKAYIANEIIKGITRGISHRLTRDECFARRQVQDAGQSAHECLAQLSR